MSSIGLALGGGGAKGFAHIPILEAFDELGIKPACIVGTSIGAVMGALYASGYSARDIVEMIQHLLVPPTPKLRDIVPGQETLKILNLLDPQFSFKPKGLIKGDKFLSYLCEQMHAATFEELAIPLKTVATDFWNRTQVVFESGDLMPAVRASMALPSLIEPVIINNHILVDGGLVNNVPFDLIDCECNIRIAVDIIGTNSTPPDKIPTPLDAIFHTYQVMMNATTQAKLEKDPVDIYVQPPLLDIDLLDFHKPWEIYEQGLQIKDAFKRRLDALLSEKAKHNKPGQSTK
jgi:NTE family protein